MKLCSLVKRNGGRSLATEQRERSLYALVYMREKVMVEIYFLVERIHGS